jgi:SAM-dependent methyltransferase
VLEIGCGTGLLLFALAEHVEAYVGTDFSAPILAYTRRMVARSRWAERVRLLERPAHEFDGLEPGTFDVVVLNSLVQYFPDTDYLLDVLRQGLRCLRPGGRLFIGDVRALALQRAFHASVQLHRSADGSSTRALAYRVRQRLDRDSELLLDPAFFQGPVAALPGVGAVATMAKRGRARNELTQFRFDAVVYRDAPPPTAAPAWRAWTDEGWSLARLRAWLTAERPAGVAFAGVPNDRVGAACRAAARLEAATVPRTVAELRRALGADERVAAVDPEDLWQLGAELGYAVHIALTDHAPDTMDVVVARCQDGAKAADWL